MNKKHIVLVACGVIFLFLVTFSSGDEKNTVISGKIYSPKGESITIDEQAVGLSAEGDFLHSFLLEKPTYIQVDFGQQLELYLRPGDRLELQVDAEAGLRSIEVTGGSEEINRFLIDMSADSWETNATFNKNFTDIVSLDEKAYVEKIDSLWRPFEERVETFIGDLKIKDPFFTKTLEASLLYSKASILLRYPGWHRQITGDTSYHPSEGYFDIETDLDLNDAELFEQREYRAFLEDYLNYKSDELLESSTQFEDLNYRRFRVRMKVALDSFADPRIRNEMLYSFIPNLMGDYHHKGIDDLIQVFNENCTNTEYVAEIDSLRAADKAVREGCEIRTYKRVGDHELDVYIWKPAKLEAGDKRPAIAFFHGGGWECGKPEWGQFQGQHFASQGLSCFSFEYRLKTQHNATPIEGLADTKSAIRWIRQHAEEFGVDPSRVVGSGYSAGGHLVMCTAMVDGYDEPDEDLTISSAVDAMLLWVTPAKVFPGWFEQMLGGRGSLSQFDPDQLLGPDLPPMVFFQGTADDTVPPWSVKAFVEKSLALGNRCDLHLYEGQTHLNWGKNAEDVLNKMDLFLESIGFTKK